MNSTVAAFGRKEMIQVITSMYSEVCTIMNCGKPYVKGTHVISIITLRFRYDTRKGIMFPCVYWYLY